jgi:hypothetical protein
MTRLETLIDAYVPVVYEALQERYTPNCCIAGVKVTKEVFEFFGYEVSFLQTRCGLFNRTMAELQAELKGTAPTEKAEIDRWFKQGARCVLIADPRADKPNIIRSHLVNVIKGDGESWVVDPSIQQADRPQYEIAVPSAVYFPSHEIEESGSSMLDLNGSKLVYRTNCWTETGPPRDHLNSPDWVGKRWGSIAAKLINQMREVDKELRIA